MRRGSALPLCGRAGLALIALLLSRVALAESAAEWLQRAATAAREQNYAGTLVYQSAGRLETSRLTHMVDEKGEHEKLVSLDGPAREVVRNNEQVRSYYPDAKIIRVEPRIPRRAFPSLLPQQLETLTVYYVFRMAETARVAGVETQAVLFEPKDGMRYGHKLWADVSSGLLLKAQLLNERNIPIEQLAFTDIQIGIKIDRDAVRPTFMPPPPDWQMRESLPGDMVQKDTGWTVKKLPPGFAKVVEGFRTLRGKVGPVAHLVYSDGLVAVSVFVEPIPAVPERIGLSQQGGINQYRRQLDDYLVTVLGETPGTTLRQIAYSVARR
ncbi:MAG TPA: MucB/RseB C-terminal domain-containing protein [Casimicrobiaceae bacterium]